LIRGQTPIHQVEQEALANLRVFCCPLPQPEHVFSPRLVDPERDEDRMGTDARLASDGRDVARSFRRYLLAC